MVNILGWERPNDTPIGSSWDDKLGRHVQIPARDWISIDFHHCLQSFKSQLDDPDSFQVFIYNEEERQVKTNVDWNSEFLDWPGDLQGCYRVAAHNYPGLCDILLIHNSSERNVPNFQLMLTEGWIHQALDLFEADDVMPILLQPGVWHGRN